MKLKIFKLNDYDYCVGESLEECIIHYMQETGTSREEAVEEPYELQDSSLDVLKLKDEDGKVTTFREELEQKIKNGIKFPCLFASTEI